MSEAAFYHATLAALSGNYRRVEALRASHATWEEAWHSLAPRGARSPLDEFQKLNTEGIRLILREDPEFPELLREIPFPPFGIYLRGTMPSRPCRIAIVGTRNATPEGKASAKKLAGELARAGCSIVSGLALGIDATAHRGALEASGETVSILASGVDVPYPATHEELAKRILASGGALISEYPPGSPPFPYRFLERNRIVSGLAHGVLVVEAPERSGSLATARFATEQNRDVFVLPGPAAHRNFKGSHALIRQGAELVTEASHILQALGVAETPAQETLFAESPEEEAIIRALKKSSVPLSIDKIIELTNLKASAASQAVTFLLIKNLIRESGAGYMFL